MKRAGVLVAMRVAGYHNDQRSRVQLFTENHISREAADRAWAEGHDQKRNGMACACHSCKEAFHVIGTTTGPIGATTGATPCPTPSK